MRSAGGSATDAPTSSAPNKKQRIGWRVVKMTLHYDYESGHIKGKVRNPTTGTVLDIDNDLKYFTEEDLKSLQIEVYVMCGDGMLGDFAARQPADFYIDTRVGKLPFARKDIYQAVEVLKAIAIKLGLNPHDLPRPHIVGAWVF